MIKIIFKLLFFIPTKIFFPTKFIGRENLKMIDGGAVFACNHYSNWDGIILTINMYKTNFKYLSKIELAKNRFMRWFMSKMGAVFIDRGKADITAMRTVIKSLKNGEKFMIFPEGTRNKTADEGLQEMKSGVTYFAGKTGSYIVPMLIEKRPKIFRKNRVIIGKPYKINLVEKTDADREILVLEEKIKQLKIQLQETGRK